MILCCLLSQQSTSPHLYIFIDLCALGESSVNVSWLFSLLCVHPEWPAAPAWVFHSRFFFFSLRPPSFYCHFSNPHSLCLAREEDRVGETERIDENIEYTPVWSSSHSLNICFHFGVCFQLCAREYGAPKCGEGCFQVVIWHTPLFLFFFLLSS